MFGYDFLSKENLAIIGVIVLFIWRTIDALLKIKKNRRHELEKLAFDMAKIKSSSEDERYGGKYIISFYFYCLYALQKGSKLPQDLNRLLVRKEEEIANNLKHIKDESDRLEQLEYKLTNNQNIKWDDIFNNTISLDHLWWVFKEINKKYLRKVSLFIKR